MPCNIEVFSLAVVVSWPDLNLHYSSDLWAVWSWKHWVQCLAQNKCSGNSMCYRWCTCTNMCIWAQCWLVTQKEDAVGLKRSTHDPAIPPPPPAELVLVLVSQLQEELPFDLQSDLEWGLLETSSWSRLWNGTKMELQQHQPGVCCRYVAFSEIKGTLPLKPCLRCPKYAQRQCHIVSKSCRSHVAACSPGSPFPGFVTL